MDFHMESYLNEISNNFYENICDLPKVSADKLGLDIRAGYEIRVGYDFLVVDEDCIGALDYYGGFEYVDKSARVQVPGYVVFLADYCDRVNDAVNYYHENHNS